MAAWNPPAPDKEVETGPDDSDAIGDTVFSKSWVLSMMVKVVSVVNSPGRCEKDLLAIPSDSEESGARDEAPKARGQCLSREDSAEEQDEELCSSMEEELCQLWDASANADVAQFLQKNSGIDLLLGVVIRANSLRLTEIALGILANMACREVCLESLCTVQTTREVVSLLVIPDIRVLTETLRLIVTCLSHDQAQQHWIQALQQSNTALAGIIFILQSCTNEELLRLVAELLCTVFDLDTDLLTVWAKPELVKALCEAMAQTRDAAFDVCCNIAMSLQLVSTVESGASALLKCETGVGQTLSMFLQTASAIEDLSGGILQGVAAVLSVANMLLDAPQTKSSVRNELKDLTIAQFLKRLSEKNFSLKAMNEEARDNHMDQYTHKTVQGESASGKVEQCSVQDLARTTLKHTWES